MIDLQNVLNDATAAHNVPGVIAAIGSSQGITAFAATGLSSPSNDQPMAMDSIFQIASMTKAVTSVAAMQLVERGVLSLDDDIGTVLPQLANPEILTGFDDAGRAQTKPAENAITLKHLLTHTSGLGYAFTSADMAKAQGEVGLVSMAGITSPLMFEPGTDWLYGVSTDWVGLAVEAASGQSLGDYMQEHIFGPLQMHDTGFSVPPEKVGRRVELHAMMDQEFVPFVFEVGGGSDAEFHSGGGGLYSTASDFFAFMQMILNKGRANGTQILSEDSIAQMCTNQVGPIRAGKLESVQPQLGNNFDAFPDMHTGWGLGFLINPEAGPDGRAAGSLAWAGIANSYFWIDPSSDVAGLALMQYLPFADTAALEIFRRVEMAAYDRLA